MNHVVRTEALGEFAGLGVPQPDPAAGLQVPGGRAAHRRLDLTGALDAGEAEARGQVRPRQSVRGAGAGGDVAAAEQRGDTRARPSHHRQRKQQGGFGGKPAVRVEQGRADQPGTRREFGHRPIPRGRFQAACPAAVDELQGGQGLDQADCLGPPPVEFRDRTALDQPDQLSPDRVARRCVAQAGDLPLVSHHADQAEARTACDRLGEVRRLPRRVQRRAPGADVHHGPAAQRAPGDVEVQADPDLRVPVTQGAVHHVQVRLGVGHDRDVLPGLAVGGQRAQRPPVHGGVGHQQVVAGSHSVQPEGFGQRVAHGTPIAGCGQRALDQVAAPQRLGGHPDRTAPVPGQRRPAGHVGGIAVEGA